MSFTAIQPDATYLLTELHSFSGVILSTQKGPYIP